jgi:hypothetical protein
VSVKSSLNLPPPRVIQHDIEQLRKNRRRCVQVIEANDKSIEKQREEQKELRALAEDPGDYDAEACANAADRCDKHIRTFEALNKKERAKIDQYDGMIKDLEERLCLSEQMSG